ncbi:MAG: DUF4381 domain-containing protein [Gammaproteobacteria bacterium]
MDSEELLAQLADIHLPAPVSWWPLAPGWWVLAVLLVVLAGYLGHLYWRSVQQRRVRDYALGELQACHQRFADSPEPGTERTIRFVNESNSVLRRVAMVHFPSENVASLAGTDWVDFLRQHNRSGTLDESLAHALAYGRFQTSLKVDCDALYNFAKLWIRDLYEQHKTLPQPQGASR